MRRTLTLLLPYIVSAINEKMMYIFGTVNIISIPIGKPAENEKASLTCANWRKVYALYPESNQRTLEEMNLLFAAPTPWTWDAEATFATLKQEMDQAGGSFKGDKLDVEAKADSSI